MDPQNQQLVRDSWRALQPVSDDVIAAFYTRLFQSNPATRELFAQTNMTEQRKKFSNMIAEIVRVLDEPNLLVSEVAAAGRRHVGYGVHDRDYDDVGAALIWAIGQALGDKFTPQVHAAWREAYSLLAAVMRRAASRIETRHAD